MLYAVLERLHSFGRDNNTVKTFFYEPKVERTGEEHGKTKEKQEDNKKYIVFLKM
jgi:hypothetical protein